MSRQRNTKAEEYIIRHFVEESDLHKEIAAQLEADGKLGINVSAYEGGLLQFLIQLVGAKNIVEIGALYGYSTLWMAEALPADGRLLSLEKKPEHVAAAKRLLQKSAAWKKIQIVEGPALENLKTISFRPDFVFIDADKPNYANYLKWAMENVEPGGLIVGDNTFLFGALIGEPRTDSISKSALKAMAEFNETLAKSPQFRSIMIPTWEGMTVAQRLE